MESVVVVKGMFKKFMGLAVALVLFLSAPAFALPGDDENDVTSFGGEDTPNSSVSHLHEPFGYFNALGKNMLAKLRVTLLGEGGAAAQSLPADPFLFELEAILASPAFDNAVLNGITIGIDPGHQLTGDPAHESVYPGSEETKPRQTSGCIGVRTGVAEHVVNMMVANRLSTLLQASGATVVLSRADENVNLSNIDRAELMNAAEVDVWLRLHCDSSSDPELRGCTILTPSYVTTPAIFDRSYILGALVLEGFCAATGAQPRGVFTSESQTGFNHSNAPVIVVEMGCLSNAMDDVRLNRESYQGACAYGIYNGIVAFYRALPPVEYVSLTKDSPLETQPAQTGALAQPQEP